MKRDNIFNCPNCGMPITGEKCEYCGTVFIDWAVIDANTPVYIKFRKDNKIMRAKCRVSSFCFNQTSEAESFYADGEVYATIPIERASFNVHFDLIPTDVKGRECLYMVIDEDEVSQDTLKEVLDEST